MNKKGKEEGRGRGQTDRKKIRPKRRSSPKRKDKTGSKIGPFSPWLLRKRDRREEKKRTHTKDPGPFFQKGVQANI